MIDTMKIYTEIDKNLYNFILYKQNVSTKFNASTGELFYEVSSEDLKGSYDSNIHCSVGRGSKYGFINSYYIEIECSIHKVLKGHNAYDGFYNLTYCAMKLVMIIEQYYDVKLPDIEEWFCNRVDIAKNFDLDTQEKVQSYINSLKLLSFPRRKKQVYAESIYFPRSN